MDPIVQVALVKAAEDVVTQMSAIVVSAASGSLMVTEKDVYTAACNFLKAEWLKMQALP